MGDTAYSRLLAFLMRGCGSVVPSAAFDDLDALANALRSIATIIGCPANTDPLTDLDGLVSMVRGLAERAETVRVVTADRDALASEVDARIADAVTADRAAFGTWLRAQKAVDVVDRLWLARSIEHGDHIDDDAPPLPSLRMTLLLRDELHRQIATLTAARDAYRAELDRLKAHTEATSPAGVGVEFGGPA